MAVEVVLSIGMSMAFVLCRVDVVVLDLILFTAESFSDVGIAAIPISINMSRLTAAIICQYYTSSKPKGAWKMVPLIRLRY